jgi:hypothetical protein
MTLKRILTAAKHSMITGHHAPHCYSAHVIGRGYVNDGSPVFDRADYLQQLERDAQSEIDNLNYASEYAEPGYTQPAKGIVFANWNKFPRELTDILERAGYAVEWSDEWAICDGCQKAVRTSPDSYSYTPSYAFVSGEILCVECIAADPEDYLAEMSGDATRCLTVDLHSQIDLATYGYEKHNPESFESGFHPGQNDNPHMIAKALEAEGITDYLFVQDEQSQFYIRFSVWVRITKDLQE